VYHFVHEHAAGSSVAGALMRTLQYKVAFRLVRVILDWMSFARRGIWAINGYEAVTM
jgi:hypothetical protein